MPADVGVDNLLNRFGLGILCSNQPKIAVALPNTNNHLHVALCAPAAFLTRYIGFVNLNRAVQMFRSYFQHGRTDAMTEVPRCLVANSERALNLTSGHSFFGLAEQVRREKPFGEPEMGIVKDGAGRGAKLVVAAVTVVLETVRNGCRSLAATWAGYLTRPAQTFDIAAAFGIVAEHVD